MRSHRPLRAPADGTDSTLAPGTLARATRKGRDEEGARERMRKALGAALRGSMNGSVGLTFALSNQALLVYRYGCAMVCSLKGRPPTNVIFVYFPSSRGSLGGLAIFNTHPRIV